MTRFGMSLVIVVLVLQVGCDADRSRLMRDRYPSYDASIKRAIDKQYLVHGMDQEQVVLALGDPMCKKPFEFKGKSVEMWLYPPGGLAPCTTAEFRVYFERGAVVGWDRLDDPIRLRHNPESPQ